MKSLCRFTKPIIFAVRKGKKTEKDGAVAQSVEQRTENPCVAGSIPAHTTSFKLSSYEVKLVAVFFISLNESPFFL